MNKDFIVKWNVKGNVLEQSVPWCPELQEQTPVDLSQVPWDGLVQSSGHESNFSPLKLYVGVNGTSGLEGGVWKASITVDTAKKQ